MQPSGQPTYLSSRRRMRPKVSRVRASVSRTYPQSDILPFNNLVVLVDAPNVVAPATDCPRPCLSLPDQGVWKLLLKPREQVRSSPLQSTSRRRQPLFTADRQSCIITATNVRSWCWRKSYKMRLFCKDSSHKHKVLRHRKRVTTMRDKK